MNVPPQGSREGQGQRVGGDLGLALLPLAPATHRRLQVEPRKEDRSDSANRGHSVGRLR